MESDVFRRRVGKHRRWRHEGRHHFDDAVYLYIAELHDKNSRQ
jgi:hypothetical protein